MPVITDYATLKQGILDFTHRADLTSFLDYFIQGAQELINNDVFQKNMGSGIRAMEATFTGTITSGTIGVPSDWLAPKGLQIQNGGGSVNTLIFKDPQWIYDVYPVRQPQGLPAYIARDRTVFIFGPYADSGYAVQGTYYVQAPLLSGSATTNWMVTLAPYMLLAACIKKAAPFLSDPDLLQTFQAMYDDELKKLVDRDSSEAWSAATMQIETG